MSINNQFNVENNWYLYADEIRSVSGELLINNKTEISGNLYLKNLQVGSFPGLNGQKFSTTWTSSSENHKSAYNFGHTDWDTDTFFRDAPPIGVLRRFNEIDLSSNENQISYRWNGWLVPNTTDDYYFTLTSNGLSQIYIDASMIHSNPGLTYSPSNTNGMTLTVYQDYFDGATDKLGWFDTATLTTISSHNFVESQTITNTEILASPGFDYKSFKYVGAFTPTTSGIYEFKVSSDDAAYVYINNSLVTDNGGTHGVESATGSISLTAGETYNVIYLFGEAGGGHYFKAEWKYQSDTTNNNGAYNMTLLNESITTNTSNAVSLNANQPYLFNIVFSTNVNYSKFLFKYKVGSGGTLAQSLTDIFRCTNY